MSMELDRVSEDKVSKIIDVLNESEDRRWPWGSILLMERTGNEAYFRSPEIHAYVTGWDVGQLIGDIDANVEREIIWRLRRRAREELGLADLTEADRSEWSYLIESPPKWNPEQLLPKSGQRSRFTSKFLSEIYSAVMIDCPSVISALESVSDYNLSNRDRPLSSIWAYDIILPILNKRFPGSLKADLSQMYDALVSKVSSDRKEISTGGGVK